MPIDLKKLKIDPTNHIVKSRTPKIGYNSGEAVSLVECITDRGYYIVVERDGGETTEKLYYGGTRETLGTDLYRRLTKKLKKNKRLPSVGQLERGFF